MATRRGSPRAGPARRGRRGASAWDLVNTSTPYHEALPILLAHLPRDYPDAVREGIARALATAALRFGWPVFVDLFRKEASKRAKDGLAVASRPAPTTP